jgi:hypothetical protein
MANYRTSTCFRVGCSDAEAALLHELDGYGDAAGADINPSGEFLRAFPTTSAHPLSGFHEFLDNEGVSHWPCFREDLFKEDGAWHFGSIEINLEYIEAVIARVCRSALPLRFGWATTCSKLRPGAFGGGVSVVHPNGIERWTTFDLLSEGRAKAPPA